MVNTKHDTPYTTATNNSAKVNHFHRIKYLKRTQTNK